MSEGSLSGPFTVWPLEPDLCFYEELERLFRLIVISGGRIDVHRPVVGAVRILNDPLEIADRRRRIIDVADGCDRTAAVYGVVRTHVGVVERPSGFRAAKAPIYQVR